MIRILEACEHYGDSYGQEGRANAQRLRALVLLLRYSGMRIGDGVTLDCERITKNKLLLLYRQDWHPSVLPASRLCRSSA